MGQTQPVRCIQILGTAPPKEAEKEERVKRTKSVKKLGFNLKGNVERMILLVS